ncbi:MAG TPA: adenosylcobalamin-dependent ribonucleoside-diphosphate reductase [Candidatus Woesearchaeota archaeon]|nr:adenosylcobalamin-dependent ribonucleoside-diphosphate reductase [Candidatus Woesearchaeota archaeon]
MKTKEGELMKTVKELPEKIIKRDGSIVEFNIEKIRKIVKKSLESNNQYSKKLEDNVIEIVLENVVKLFTKETYPNVEQIQDVVEIAFMKLNLFDVAKSFILYREKKTAIRAEKKKLLNKEKLDSIDKQFSLNSLRVVCSRYLEKNRDGKIAETVKHLFERVSLLGGIGDLLFSEDVYSKDPICEKTLEKYDQLIKNSEEYENILSIGKYKFTKYHFEQLCYAYKRLRLSGHMKLSLPKLIQKIEEHQFSQCEILIDEYYSLMTSQTMLPNTPALVNAGRKLGLLSGCFTLNVEDDLNSIMKLACDIAVIQKMGGGTGINFSKLRQKGDYVGSTSGVSSGPISFIKMIDSISEVIKQGGVRRGANMGILDITHPDIEDFIKMKEKDGTYTTFNISVGFTKEFWDSLKNKIPLKLISPRTKETVKEADAGALLGIISYFAWSIADPGVLFFDNFNKRNILIEAKGGPITVTNPCGEEPLYPYESCNLASINIAKFVEFENNKPTLNYEKFENAVRITTRLVDNFVEVNKYPITEVEENTLLTRRLGVGLMGVADTLYLLKIKYNSKEGFDSIEEFAERLTYSAYLESVELSKKRGAFPLFEKSALAKGDLPIEGFYQKDRWHKNWQDLSDKIKCFGARNAMVTTMPPTGSVSMIADTSSGMEPNFSLVFTKNVVVGDFYYVNSIFEMSLKNAGIYSEELLKAISNNYGSVQGLQEIPKELRDVFVTAMDIHWLDHIVAQASMQKWTTDSISKTINMTNEATVEEIKQAYIFSHELGCKGVTVYRDGSKYGQVLNVDSDAKKKSFTLTPCKYSVELIKNIMETKPWIANYINISKLYEDSNQLNLKEISLGTTSTKNSQLKSAVPRTTMVNTLGINDKEERCPSCNGKLIMESGCVKCIDCGWSKCSIS